MLPGLEPSGLPDDAIEVGRILDAWGVKGWVKILAHSASSEALFSSGCWFLQPPEAKHRPGFDAFSGTVTLDVSESKTHSDSVVAKFAGIDDRTPAEALRGARIFVPRSSFPKAGKDEYYWVDLIGLDVVNREGEGLGVVRELLTTGPQTVLVLDYRLDGELLERMIPFVSVFIDDVDLTARRILVDWQADF